MKSVPLRMRHQRFMAKPRDKTLDVFDQRIAFGNPIRVRENLRRLPSSRPLPVLCFELTDGDSGLRPVSRLERALLLIEIVPEWPPSAQSG